MTMPLYENYLRGRIEFDPAYHPHLRKMFLDAAPKATRIDAADLWMLFEDIRARLRKDEILGWEQHQRVTPPWRTSWIEWRIPKQFACPVRNYGAIVLSSAKGEKEYDILLGKLHKIEHDTELDPAHIIVAQPMWSYSNCEVTTVAGNNVVFAVDGAGSILSAHQVGPHPLDGSLMGAPCQMPLLAFRFANARNIVTKEKKAYCRPKVRTPRTSDYYSYHVLRITGNVSGSQSGETTGEGDHTTPRHICRGHFKSYSAERPLFGKLSGDFWWEEHARGNAKHGTIETGYAIGPAPVASVPMPEAATV